MIYPGSIESFIEVDVVFIFIINIYTKEIGATPGDIGVNKSCQNSVLVCPCALARPKLHIYYIIHIVARVLLTGTARCLDMRQYTLCRYHSVRL